MFILTFFRFFRGTVRFTVQGDFVERFLNLVARDKIPIWDGRRRGDEFSACTAASSYPKLRRHARKARVRLRVRDKAGLPFQRRKYRKRVGLLVGAALFATFVFTMGQFLWRIEINGNESIPDSAILQALEELGIRSGSLRAGVDVRDAERRSLLLLQDLSWIALNIDGSVLRVEVNESVAPPDMVDPDKPCNVVASDTGQVLTLRVYAGQALVKEGDAVARGDVLVSGITQDRKGQNLFRHALADVVALVEEDVALEIPLAGTHLVETGETAGRSTLNILGLELPLYLPVKVEGAYRVEREEIPLRFFTAELPVVHHRQVLVFMEEVPVEYTEEEARDLALERLALVEEARFGQGEILERTAKGGVRDGAFVVEAHYVATKSIGVEREILLGE